MYSFELDVAGICLVYNNGQYIQDCLTMMAEQNVNFRYKVYVYDNASTDNSKAIIEEMYRRYPDVIIPMFAENHVDSWNRCLQDILCNFEANYVAICKGDEFFADNSKLQLQYNFMENNADYGICATNTLIRRRSGESRIHAWKQEHTLKPEELFMERNVHLSSFLIRKKVAECKLNVVDYDFLEYVLLTQGYDYGKTMVMPQVMSICMAGPKKDDGFTAEEIEEMKEKITYLEKYDSNTSFDHNRIVEMTKDKLEFNIGLYRIDNGQVTRNDLPELKKSLRENSYYNEYVNGLSFTEKVAFKFKLK